MATATTTTATTTAAEEQEQEQNKNKNNINESNESGQNGSAGVLTPQGVFEANSQKDTGNNPNSNTSNHTNPNNSSQKNSGEVGQYSEEEDDLPDTINILPLDEIERNPMDRHSVIAEQVREETLTQLQGFRILGYTDDEIKSRLELSSETYNRYVEILASRAVETQLKKRGEYFIFDINEAKERVLMNKRYLASIISDKKVSHKDRLEAIQFNASLDMTLLKLNYEGTIYLREIAKESHAGQSRFGGAKLEHIGRQASTLTGKVSTPQPTKDLIQSDSQRPVPVESSVDITEAGRGETEREVIRISAANKETADTNRVA